MYKRLLKISKWFIIVSLSVIALTSALLILFKDDIKSYAIQEINKNLNKKLNVSYIDISFWSTFPSLSLEFDNILIHDKFDTLQKIDTALYAKKLTLKLNPIDVIKGDYSVKKIEINHAQVHLKVNENNVVNYDFLRPSEKADTSNFDFVLEEILLTKTAFSYSNKITKQQHSAFFEKVELIGDFTSSVFTLNAQSIFKINELKSDAITLVKNKNATCNIELSIDNKEELFEIKKADLKIQSLPFQLSGKVAKDSIVFAINARNLALTDFAQNFSMQELNKVQEMNGAGTFSFNLSIKGENRTDKPTSVYADFNIDNGSLKSNQYALHSINANGFYSNTDGQNMLNLKALNFESKVGSFKSNFTIRDFNKPRIKGKAKGYLNLAAVHHLFGPFGLQELNGTMQLNSGFDIVLNDLQYNPKDIRVRNINGNIFLNNINAKFINDPRIFEGINGEIVVRNQNAGFNDVRLKIGETDLNINGDVKGIANYFKGDGNLYTSASINAKQINVTDFSSSNQSTTSFERAWVLPTRIKGSISLNAGLISYGGHQYRNISTQLKLTERALQFHHLSGENATATVTGNVMVKEEYPSQLALAVDLKSNNINFKPLFKEWNNFDQTVINANNIDGIAKVKLKFSAPFDLINGLVKESIASTINIDIEKGALTNVSTFKEITKSLKAYGGKLVIANKKIDAFEKKLLNLTFEKMSNELVIKNGVLFIPEMTIKSNALDVTLSGEHHFDNEIDYHFDFRFRELKGKNNQTEFGEIIDDRTGFIVYLRMYGDLDNPNFAWDKAQKKINKQKEREQEIITAKTILKQGFSLKKDTTQNNFNLKPQLKEEVHLDFGQDTTLNDLDKDKKKDSKFLKNLEKWKKENEEENKVEFEIGG